MVTQSTGKRQINYMIYKSKCRYKIDKIVEEC